MSTAMLLDDPTTATHDEDDEMDADADGEDEGQGEDIGPEAGDSSEEESEGSEEEREFKESGFIDEDESSSRRSKKKRRKHKGEEGSRKRRKDDDDDAGDLDEDDLALLEENTGMKLTRGDGSHKLKRLRRHRSASAGSEGSVTGLRNIFDDDERGADAEIDTGLFDADEMAGFIEDDSQSDSSGRHGSSEDEEERQQRRRLKKTKAPKKAVRRSVFGAGIVEGITSEAWSEVTEVFGNGQDYGFALDDEVEDKEEKGLKDIFEPSEIASRMLTEKDDKIRLLDIPERMQLASAGLPELEALENGAPAPFIAEEDLEEAAAWMSSRISPRCIEDFLLKEDLSGEYPVLHDKFLKAVADAIRFLNVDFLEVPFIWHHRSDFLVHHDPTANDPSLRNLAFLDQADLWRISALSIKYRALVHRKNDLKALFDQLDVEDDYFDEIVSALESVEEVADASDWLAMKYATKLAEIKEMKDGENDEAPKKKRAARESRYENAKRNVVSKLAEAIAVSATQLSQDFVTLNKKHFIEDPGVLPLALAEEYATGEYKTAELALDAAKFILVHEISRDPMLKKEARRFFKDYGVVNVRPTEKGISKIDEMHPFYTFKYLEQKPVGAFHRSAQFLQILSAEAEGLVKCTVVLPDAASDKLISDLGAMYKSDYSSAIAEAWNGTREDIIRMAVKEHLAPAAEVWARNLLQEEEEEFVGKQCAAKLDQRVNVAPFCRADGSMKKGDIPSVLAISHGAGDPKRDSVIAVFTDQEGHLREYLKLDTLHPEHHQEEDYQGPDTKDREALADLLRRRRPQVIVVGGFSPSTKGLMGDVQIVANKVSEGILTDKLDVDDDEWKSDDNLKALARFETHFVYDDVARIYQNSKRATTEFPDLPLLGKYCVGLARYAQSPLNEYAALGSDLTALTYDPNQKLLSREKATHYLERALIEVTNKVGVDINRATRNPYYYSLLPYVSGLGPRKASSVVKKINGPIGGTLTTRQNLVVQEVLSTNVFINAAAFLRIPQDLLRTDLKRNVDAEDGQPDILDDTRIHPEDYDVARKMAADAMEYDEEDIAGLATPSQAVADVMDDDLRKLDELSLDDFASELAKILGVPKRLSLYGIRDEMQGPYAETRQDFVVPSFVEVFTMFTGETQSTLDRGLIIPVRVVSVKRDDSVLVRLDSGVEGTIASEYRTDGDFENVPKPRPGQIVQALVMELKHDTFEVELSTQEHAIARGDFEQRRVHPDPSYYNRQQAEEDKQVQVATAQKKGGRIRRQINHPNFHNFSAGEAEQFLANQQRGQCVIRPSSKEDHLAVTWKVDDGIYQHIAVTELDKINSFSIGVRLRIDSKHQYSDLDELINNHIKGMAKKVEEMLAHEKYRGSQEELNLYLQNFTMANPGQSAYGFGIKKEDPKLAGQFVVSFRSNNNVEIQTWPVKVVPGAFSLLGEEHGDVMALCNAFKTAYQTRLASGARLPNPTPRHPGLGRTPNPYAARTPNPYASPAMGRGTPMDGGRGTPMAQFDPRTAPSPYPSHQPVPQSAYGRTPLYQGGAPQAGPSGAYPPPMPMGAPGQGQYPPGQGWGGQQYSQQQYPQQGWGGQQGGQHGYR